MLTETEYQQTRAHLFAPPAEVGTEPVVTYAILDGASVRSLPDSLVSPYHCEYVCLFRGEMDRVLETRAPYLVKLGPEESVTQWILREGWGGHWGIFCKVPADTTMDELRRHFRRFLQVRLPDNEILLFRFYDPRVFGVYLPTCEPEETAYVYGPVLSYSMEDDEGASLLEFLPNPQTNGVDSRPVWSRAPEAESLPS